MSKKTQVELAALQDGQLRRDRLQSAGDQEGVDGILINIKETEMSVAGEQPGQVQRRSGYVIAVAIPDWDKNRTLLNQVRKGCLAQQKLFTKLQDEGVRRRWMIEHLNEFDKALATTLTTVAERIRTRR